MFLNHQRYNAFRSAARTLVFVLALFGLASATVLMVLPEKIPDIAKSLYAFGSRDYRLPEPASSVVQPDADSKALKAFSKIFVNIGKQTRPSLVYIESKRVVKGRQRNPLEDFFFGFPFGAPPGRERGGVQQGAGSGFIIDLKNGYVMTNNHVIDGMTELRVQTFDNRSFNAKVIGSHKDTDIAVVQLEGFSPQNLKQVALTNSDAVEVGDWVVALGAPFQLPQTLTVGVVSATGRQDVIGEASSLQDFIQTDAAINPGNSGGPLLNLDGQVIGINTAIYSRTGSYSGIGFAVPAKMARNVAESLINNNGKVARGYLGVGFGEDPTSAGLPEGTKGVVVTKIYPKTPAEKSGLKIYDVIQSINDQPVTTANDLKLKVGFTKPGETLTLGLLRDGKKLSLKVTLAEYSDEVQKLAANPEQAGKYPVAESFGLLLQELTPDLRKTLGARAKEGALVGDVDENSEGGAQLQQGDVILEINRTKVKNPRDAERILAQAKESNKNLVFLIERDGTTQLVVFRGQFRGR